jgi:hypothetical protein
MQVISFVPADKKEYMKDEQTANLFTVHNRSWQFTDCDPR